MAQRTSKSNSNLFNTIDSSEPQGPGGQQPCSLGPCPIEFEIFWGIQFGWQLEVSGPWGAEERCLVRLAELKFERLEDFTW